MGGCRCVFRDCKNGSKSTPGMHYFHFPYQDPERCKKWALYTGRTDFLKMPHAQLRNKTVCSIHFTDKCFMNYLKERLTRMAVPTLQRTANGQMIEVDIDESQLAKLEYPVRNNPLTIDLPEAIAEKTLPADDAAAQIAEAAVDEPISQNCNDDTEPTLCKKPKVLNKIETTETNTQNDFTMNTYGSCQIKRIPNPKFVDARAKLYELPAEYNPLKRRIIRRSIILPQPLTSPAETVEAEVVDNTPNTKEIANDSDTDDNMHLDQDEPPAKSNEMDKETVDKASLLNMLAEQTKQMEELKKMIADKFERVKNEPSAPTTTTPPPPPPASIDIRSELKMAKGPAMTKIQLFNGIRKYLNPSMVALLRMEIFGGAEREYRSDEKQVAIEMYNLNATVYDYLRDEWRFRLPTKAQVESWLNEPDDGDISEFF